MNLPEISIKKPVFVSCIIALIIIVGLISVFSMNIDQFPNVNYPIVSVIVPYRGAGSEEVTERDGGSGHGSSFVQTRPGRPVNATAGRPNP